MLYYYVIKYITPIAVQDLHTNQTKQANQQANQPTNK